MSLIDDSGVRIITLVGPGGVGKTRLALEVARTVRRAAAREVAYIELAAVRDANHVLQTIAQTLAIPRSPDNSALSRIEEVLRDLDILLVLDNFEHLLGASEVLVDILTACPRICMLVTSRSVLKVSGEHVV
ncbi:MAG: AAA family ATPase [Thermomicrobiales bacterium]|nr:AAA family ATPase [Thermomicrobiales bacterium]MCO5223500.1 AAA family ATPase [Thermomicrobiales bacterium]